MVAEDGRSRIELSDPRALRALAHPTRLKLVGLLRMEGPMTATQAAAKLGESSGSMSFHLRQLAKYGLVEETGEGEGRQKPWRAKPWRATAQFTAWPALADSPETATALDALNATVAQFYVDRLTHWLHHREREPAPWREAAGTGDMFVHVTAAELVEIDAKLCAVLEEYLPRNERPELRPEGSRPVDIIRMLLPVDEPET